MNRPPVGDDPANGHFHRAAPPSEEPSVINRSIARRRLAVLCVITAWCLWIAGLFVPAVLFAHINMDPAPEYGYACLFYAMFPYFWLFAPMLLPYAFANVVFFIAPFFLRTNSDKRLMCIRIALGLSAAVALTVPVSMFSGLLLGYYLWLSAIVLTTAGLWIRPEQFADAYE